MSFFQSSLDKSDSAIFSAIQNELKRQSNQIELIQLIKVFQSINFFRNRYSLFFNLDDFLYDINLHSLPLVLMRVYSLLLQKYNVQILFYKAISML